MAEKNAPFECGNINGNACNICINIAVLRDEYGNATHISSYIFCQYWICRIKKIHIGWGIWRYSCLKTGTLKDFPLSIYGCPKGNGNVQ